MALLLVVLALAGDYLAGPFVQFPILYVIPVAFTAWYIGRGWALGFSVLLPAIRLGFVAWWEVPWSIGYSVVNALIRLVVLAALALLTHKVAQHTRALEGQVRALQGILPICGFCKKIREDDGSWRPLEQVVAARSQARFSHTFCRECGIEHYGELAED